MILCKSDGMGCAFGFVVYERYTDIRILEDHLLIADKPGTLAVLVPVGRAALNRPAVSFPDVFRQSVSTLGAGSGNEKRLIRLTSLFPPVAESPVYLMYILPCSGTGYKYLDLL